MFDFPSEVTVSRWCNGPGCKIMLWSCQDLNLESQLPRSIIHCIGHVMSYPQCSKLSPQNVMCKYQGGSSFPWCLPVPPSRPWVTMLGSQWFSGPGYTRTWRRERNMIRKGNLPAHGLSLMLDYFRFWDKHGYCNLFHNDSFWWGIARIFTCLTNCYWRNQLIASAMKWNPNQMQSFIGKCQYHIVTPFQNAAKKIDK